MRYLYNPKTKGLDDIETPKLGEKYFASAETEEIIRQINEQHGPGTLFPASEAPQPEIKTPQAIFEFGQRNPAAHGGMMRQNYGNGAEVMTLSSMFPKKDLDSTDFQPLDVPGMLIPAGVGVGAVNLYDKLISMFKNKPGDESKEDIVNRIEKIKKDNEDPEQEPPEDNKILETILKGVKNYEHGKEISDAVKKIKKSDLKKDFKNEAWKEKMIVTGSYAKGDRSVSVPGENISFFKDLNNFANEKHGGVLKEAVKDITGLDKKSKEFNNIYVKIQNAAKTRDFKFDLQGLNLPQDLLIKGEKNNFSDLTTILKTNPEILKDRLKPFIDNGTLNRNKVYNRSELAEIFGVDLTGGTKEQNIRQASNFMETLEKNGATYKDLPGGKKGFTLYEAENAIFDYSRLKQIRDGENNKSETNIIRQLDDPGFETFRANFYRDFDKNLTNLTLPGGEKLVLPDSTAQVGHNPIPIAYKKTLKMFKDKKLSDKIFNLGNLTFQDTEINTGTLMRTQGKLLKNLKIIDRYYGKNISKNNIGPLTEAHDGLIDYFTKANKTAKEKSKEFGFVDSNVIPELTFNIPKIGEKLTEKNFNVDISKVGKQHIVGYVDQVNNKAVKFNDLSKKQKKEYAQNFLDQKISQLRSFYKDANYSPELIEEIIDALLVGTMPSNTDYTQGVLEKEVFKIKKAAGGVVPDPGIMKYADGGRVNYEDGSPNPQLDGNAFLNKLEFNFNNIDDVTLDDEPITYDDSKSKIAQFNDLLDVRNIPYIGDMAAQAALRVGEFGARIIPALGELGSDLLQKPLFKGPGAESDTYDPEGTSVMLNGEEQFLDVKQKASSYERNPITDYTNPVGKDAKFVGGPVFTNFLENITPTSTEKLVGLDTLINEEKKKMIARGDSSLMVKVGETASLGAELIAPIFPGLKLFRAYASAKGLKANKETGKLLEQEIDQMAAARGMNRREFLTATGAVGTLGIAKLLGIAGEVPKIAKVTEAVTSVAKNADGVPEYLYDLMRVMRMRGKQQPSSSAFLDGQEVYTYKGITLYHNTYPKDGSFRIAKEFETNSSVPGEPSYNKIEMEVNRGGDVVVDEGLSTQKVTRAADEYEEATAYPAREGGEDMDFYVDDDYHKQLKEIADELDEINQKVEIFGWDK